MPRPEDRRIDLKEVMKKTDYYDGKTDVAKLGSGDSFYISDFLKKKHKELFKQIQNEAEFVQMFNIGKNQAEPIPRLVSAQAARQSETTTAIYRMPGCNEKNFKSYDWTPTVKYICDKASHEIEQTFNHCVLALFKDQNASIAFHKDKVYDLKDNSYILSISLGDTRAMLLYSTDGKQKQTIMLRPGSLLAIGPKTNQQFMHSIPKLTDEVGPRISLSLRTTKTYIEYKNPLLETKSHETFLILGKGSEFQTTNYPFSTSHDDSSAYMQNIKSVINTDTK